MNLFDTYDSRRQKILKVIKKFEADDFGGIKKYYLMINCYKKNRFIGGKNFMTVVFRK